MTPRVSVIIPSYNRATLLAEALASVFNQTYRDYEVIVADDGSADGTRELLAAYGSRLYTLFLAHSGMPARVVNAGLRAARGEVIAFLDSDDWWLPDKLEQQVSFLDAGTRFGFGYGNLMLLRPDGTMSGPVLAPRQLRPGWILHELARDMFVHPSTLVVRRELIERVGWPDVAAAEHYPLLLRLARVSQAASVHEPVAVVRRHPGQLSVEHDDGRTYESAIRALEDLAREPLSWSIRLEVRRTLARHHTHLARMRLLGGEPARALRHLTRALAQYPLHRPAWRWAFRLLLKLRR